MSLSSFTSTGWEMYVCDDAQIKNRFINVYGEFWVVAQHYLSVNVWTPHIYR